MVQHHPRIVLVLAGNDPSGGAGIMADIEAIASMGCQAAPVITAYTPGSSRARVASTRLMTAWACGLRSSFP